MRFYFAAQNKDGNTIQGDIDAKDRDDAVASLGKRGLSPFRIEAVVEPKTTKSVLSGSLSLGPQRLSAMDEINIVRHLGTIMNTGTDLLAGLDMIAEDAINPFEKKMIFDIRDKIGRGEKFSDALASWQNQFNPIFVSMVRAGEASGNLPNILLSYAGELRKDYTFMRRLKGALVYPIILVVALIAMLILILTVVTPRLKELFTTTRSAPPAYTQIFFAASDIWLAHTTLIIVLALILGIGILSASKMRKTRDAMLRLVWYIPVINKIQKNLALMRFSKTLSNLLKAGFSLKSALTTSIDVATPQYHDPIAAIANDKLERGIAFSASLGEYPQLFPKILISVVKTGERSGQLSSVLAQMGEFYEEEVIYALELFLTLIEPMLLLIVGLIVGLIASALIGPIYRLIGSIR